MSAHSLAIWDVINLAWLMGPAWVASELVRTPVLGADRRWHPRANGHLMREG